MLLRLPAVLLGETVDRAHYSICRRAVRRTSAKRLVYFYGLAHEDFKPPATEAGERSWMYPDENWQHGSAASDREYDDPALGFPGGSVAPVCTFGEDSQSPPFGQESESGAYCASPSTLAVDGERPDELEEAPEREGEELLLRHPLQAPWNGNADQNRVSVLAVVGGHYQGSFGRHSLSTVHG